MTETNAEFNARMARELYEKERPRKGRGAARNRILAGAAERLGPEWVVIDKGINASLLWTPVRWWYCAIGNTAAPNREELTVSHFPLLVPLHPGSYVFDQDGYAGTRYYLGDTAVYPTSIDLFDLDAGVEMVCWWALGPAMERFTLHSDRRMTELLEITFRDHLKRRPLQWPQLAGWRALYGTGDPIEVIENMIDVLINHGGFEENLPFWQEFHDVAAVGDRVATVRWLDGQRRRVLTDLLGLPDRYVADVIDTDSQPLT
ncbi:hypothetical protein ABIC28_002641 [Rhodococcus sp. PvR044]|uniref:hypothetical protein n=1 Tax=Rhodococcus sp. PvR044 TaxID=3156402 RepID=UPI003395BB3A